MTMRDRIRRLFKRAKSFFGIIPTWEVGQPQYTPHSYENFAREGYRKNEVIFACIKEIATAATEPKLRVYKIVRDGDMEEAPDHPLQRLIERPNRFLTEQQLWETYLTNLNIAGNNYLAKVRTNAGMVAQLWPLRPDRVRIVPSRDEFIAGYIYEVAGQKMAIKPDDLMHDKYYDPMNDYYGLSPVAVAARVGDVDNAATDFLKRFFDQGVQVPAIIKYKGRATEADRERIRKKWRSQYGGFKKWADIGVLDEDADYQKIGLDFREMDFGNLRSMSEARICSVFGVPPILAGVQIGLERSTYANYREAKKSFWEETLMHLFRKIRDKIQMELVPDFGDDLVVEWDFSEVKALQANVNEAWQRATAAFAASMITRNMALAEIGMDEVPGGDVFLQGMMLLEIPAGQSKSLAVLRPEYKELPSSEVKGERWGRMVNLTARAWEGVFSDKAKSLFAEEKEEVLKLLKREGKATKQGVAFQGFLMSAEQYLGMAGETWREAFLPLFQALLSAQGENIAAAFGISFDMASAEVELFLKTYAMKFAEGIVSTTGKTVKDIITEGQREGWTVTEMRKTLTETFEQFDRVRAERIARTETIRSSNAGSVEAYRLAGVRKKQWWAALDDRTCPYCADLHGKVIGIEEIFLEGGTEYQPEGAERALKVDYGDVGYPPAHVGCRCTALPVIEGV